MSALFTTWIFWLAVTVGVFELIDMASRRLVRHPLLNPVLWSTPILIAILLVTGTAYDTYYDATMLLTFMFGPAVVGLAVPIWGRRAIIRRLAVPILLALLAGAVTAVVSVVGLLWLFGAPPELLASVAPRATTTPVAMGLAVQLGGIPALAAIATLFSGVVGAMTGRPLFNFMKIDDYQARGFAVGITSHGIGAARAFQTSISAGTFASLGMGLNAIATSILLSVLSLAF